MKDFLKKLAVFLSPFLLPLILVLLIDPYDYYGMSIMKGDAVKQKIAKNVDSNRRTSISLFMKNPTRNIIVGASQAEHINVSDIPGRNWSNLCQGGANISDEIETFWAIANKFELDSIIFSIEPYNFLQSNGKNVSVITKDALKFLDEPWHYFIDRYVYKAIFQFFKAKLTNEISSEAPDMGRDEFWQVQLSKARNVMNNPIDGGG